ncbi:hypothetical protein COLO4_19777 [Corchorus olitorius]|uniref:Uncharacterized protein n=1 Tax=Corchorus olitorius TaxID=93759 RepID=A0A1R3J3K1_9ROSI|nr:hypothetical protein COLO4_19777 [Corchorus olitorius]
MEDKSVNGMGVDDDCSETLSVILRRLFMSIVYPDQVPSASATSSTPLLRRIRLSLHENGPHLSHASKNSCRSVLLWTRRGSPLRALLVISIGTITLLTLTGLLVFMLFFLAATANAVIISLFISLAAAGGFLALFFACVAAIYIGALSIAAFVISTATISAIVAALIATGWVGFFCIVWLVTKKSLGLAKHSLSATGSIISTYSSARAHRARHFHRTDKVSD